MRHLSSHLTWTGPCTNLIGLPAQEWLVPSCTPEGPMSGGPASTSASRSTRAVLADGVFRVDFFLYATGLNLVYFCAGMGVFLYCFRLARIHGLLLQTGE